jgi:hypothetical protein
VAELPLSEDLAFHYCWDSHFQRLPARMVLVAYPPSCWHQNYWRPFLLGLEMLFRDSLVSQYHTTALNLGLLRGIDPPLGEWYQLFVLRPASFVSWSNMSTWVYWLPQALGSIHCDGCWTHLCRRAHHFPLVFQCLSRHKEALL